MKDRYKTKAQLIEEVAELRRQVDINGRRRMESELQASLRKLRAVDMLSIHLQKRFDVEELLGEAVALARDITGSDYAAIGIVGEKWKYEYFFQSGFTLKQVEEMKKRHGLPVGKGLLGHLLATGKPLRTDNISRHPESAGFPEGHPGMKAFLGVPIMSGDNVLGRLYFTNAERVFSEGDQEVAQVIAERVGVALEIARLYTEEKRTAEELALLYRITSAVSGSLSLEEIASRALEETLKLELCGQAKRGVFFLAEEETRTLRMLTQVGLGDEIKEMCSVVPYGECLCGITAESGKMLISADCFEDARHTIRYRDMAGHGHVNLPLKAGEKFIGVLTVYRPPGERTITSREKSLLTSITDIVSVALYNALHHAEVEYLASFPMENPYPILELDADCNIVYFNPATEKFTAQFGLQESDLLPSHICDFIKEMRSQSQAFAYQEILTPSRDMAAYINIRQETGTARVFIFDITEQKRMESALIFHGEELLALTDASNSLLEIVSTEDTYKRICDIALEVFDLSFCWIGIKEEGGPDIEPVAFAGSEEDYLEGIRVRWDDSPEGRGPVGSAFRAMKPYIVYDVETDPAFAPWREQALARGFRSVMSAPLIHRNEVMGVLTLYSAEPYFFTEDRTGIIQALANQAASAIENSELVKGLEEKVLLRTSELEYEKVRAEEASGAKSDFLASMSHELRTPMNAILGFSQVLQEKYFGDLTEKQEEYVDDILTSGQHLLSLINDILDLSKVEAGKMELEYSDVDLKGLLENSLVMIKEKAMKHGISLDLKADPELDGMEIAVDERKLKQVMFNLLSNAAKFTPDGGAITVMTSRRDDEIQISVTDTGIGLSPGDLDNIFGEFYQVMGAGSDKTPGTGLGLPLTKSFVELHGGRIQVESEGEGKGSTFTFTIPVKVKVSAE